MKIDLQAARKFGNIELLARQMVEGFITGLHKSPYHGFSVEFAEHKIYNTGESTRHIDWKLYARTDRLYTKRYEEETNLRCQILIDVSSSMYYPAPNYDKLSFSLLCTAALCYMLQGQRDAVGITTFSNAIELQTPVKSTSTHIHKLMIQLEQLLQAAPSGKTTFIPETIHTLADTLRKRGLVVIFSDMFDSVDNDEALFAALNHLKHSKHEVLLFHTYHGPTELKFEFSDRPYQFIDAETGEKLKLKPADIQKEYETQMQSRFQDLKMKCGQYKIDYIAADVTADIEQILIPYLVSRNKMSR